MTGMTAMAGRWEVEWASALGTEHIELEIAVDGDVVTGVARDDVGEYELSDVRIEGDTVTGAFKMTKPVKLTVTFEIRIKGDTMRGKAKAGILPKAPITGHRVTGG